MKSEEMDDRKPSQFYHHLRKLASPSTPDGDRVPDREKGCIIPAFTITTKYSTNVRESVDPRVSGNRETRPAVPKRGEHRRLKDTPHFR